MLGFVDPHGPFDPPAPWSSMYDPDEISLLPGWVEKCSEFDIQYSSSMLWHEYNDITEKQLRRATAFYYGMISQIDSQVGRVIATLEQRGLYVNTMIIYTSDHGEYMGYHRFISKCNHLYEPLVKVPLIIKYPQQAKHGTSTDALISLVDLAPTILQCSETEVPASMKGLDLFDESTQRECVFAESYLPRHHYMARTKTRKLLEYEETEKSMYFNLEEDPLEMNNLFVDPDYQSEISEFRNKLARWKLYDTRIYSNQNYDAPLIKTDNALTHNDAEAKSVEEYYRKRMAEPI